MDESGKLDGQRVKYQVRRIPGTTAIVLCISKGRKEARQDGCVAKGQGGNEKMRRIWDEIWLDYLFIGVDGRTKTEEME